MDAFVVLPPGASGLILLTPIYEALAALGGQVEREYVRFSNWPVQILPDANALVVEAILRAIAVDFDGTPTRVFRAEHLCAIALQTGRAKDYLRVQMFLEQRSVNWKIIESLAGRFGLLARLNRLRMQEKRSNYGRSGEDELHHAREVLDERISTLEELGGEGGIH